MCSLQCNYPLSKDKETLLSLSYTAIYFRGNSPCTKCVSSSTFSLYWCSGYLLTTSKEVDKTLGS